MDHKHLRNLISQWLDGGIEPDDFRSLSGELRESEQARGVFLAAMAVHAELANSGVAEHYLAELTSGNLAGETARQRAPSRGWPSAGESTGGRTWPAIAISASVLVSVVGWAAFGSGFFGNAEPGPGLSARRLLAAARPASADCQWYVEHSNDLEPSSLRQGDVVRVTKGRLAFDYQNGTTVELESPAACELLSSMRARVLLGRLTAEVTEEGKGFAVIAPRATVVDLGTRFSVNVENDGATDVVVFKGEVDVDFQADGAGVSSAQRLHMGEAVRVDAAGTASRIVSIRSQPFSHLGGGDDAPIMIAEVRDNIERLSALNYYEIVHRGMREDALAFVDREAHEWNGVEESGMPAYLVGGDYVKTFNNDKFNHVLRLRVSLAVPANLYVLFDNRLPIPAWLSTDFVDTGDDIGLDVGRFFTKGQWHNEGPAGIGPGESVEDTFSVWVKKVSEPGPVHLGATEAPKPAPNMYGIVAVPLDAGEQE